MNKKNYDTSKVANELTGASAFFKSTEPVPDKLVVDETPPQVKATKAPPPAAPVKDANGSSIQPDDRPTARPSVRPTGRTPVRSVTRYAFEFYFDQIDELKARSLDDRIRGGSGNMSQMVRQALDEYLERHPREEP